MANAREIALQILLKFDNDKAYSNLLLNSELNKNKVSDIDKSLITKLVYGVISNRNTLDYIISKISTIKLKKIATPVLTILRIGLYQIFFLEKIPASAACNESVKLAKKYGHVASAGFVNAVLRNAPKKTIAEYTGEIRDVTERFSIRYSHPKWMISLWLNKFGQEGTEKILQENNKEPKNYIRVNTLKTTMNDLKEILTKQGFEVFDTCIPDIIRVNDIKFLFATKYFKKGYFTFQDIAPSLVGHILQPKEGEKILDMCAAPGGKTTHIAQISNDKASIIALEIHEQRAKLIEDLVKKMGIGSVEVKVADATEYQEEYQEMFDKIVVDAPCSGLGVIRRKPDIKWNTEENDIYELAKIQRNILENASKYLKKGGILLYSTCTNTDVENKCVANDFINKHSNFKVEKIENLSEIFISGLTEEGYLELSPYKQDCDGFFIATFRKIEI